MTQTKARTQRRAALQLCRGQGEGGSTHAPSTQTKPSEQGVLTQRKSALHSRTVVEAAPSRVSTQPLTPTCVHCSQNAAPSIMRQG
jgi:hypothetical protein